MEASALIRPEFWESDAPVMLGGGPVADVPGLVFFRTSGSTGTPKWIGLSRRALLVKTSTVAALRHSARITCDWSSSNLGSTVWSVTTYGIDRFSTNRRTWSPAVPPKMPNSC